MGGESSKSDGRDGRSGRQRSTEAINAVFVANVCIFYVTKFYNHGHFMCVCD